MLRALSTGAASMAAQQIRLNTGANNLANINTAGYKRQGVTFADLLYQEVGREGIPNVPGAAPPAAAAAAGTPPQATAGAALPPQAGGGVRVVTTPRDFSPGALIRTGRPLDVAIQGEGFFRVLLPNGQYAYTRAGSFTVDATGRIVTQQGYLLDPEITLPPGYSSLTLHSDGRVTIINSDQQYQELGRLSLYTFNNPAGLASRGDNLYLETAESGPPVAGLPEQNGAGSLAQGWLEGSNADITRELVDLIEAQRAYQLDLQVVRTADELWSMANNMRK
ncbi:MAG: flagellar basal-body rod protein FlgG [Thermoanaerobacteraceae bacterium]|nr:flagellar basal-body rod protein FlgG [Thermoanaerobacteraceae bacterium]